jgi:hypothetical protein
MKPRWHESDILIALLAAAVILLCAIRADAADISPPLTLDRAKAVIAARGGVGSIFADGDNRYMVSRIESRGTPRRNVFSVEIEITPLARHTQ